MQPTELVAIMAAIIYSGRREVTARMPIPGRPPWRKPAHLAPDHGRGERSGRGNRAANRGSRDVRYPVAGGPPQAGVRGALFPASTPTSGIPPRRWQSICWRAFSGRTALNGRCPSESWTTSISSSGRRWSQGWPDPALELIPSLLEDDDAREPRFDRIPARRRRGYPADPGQQIVPRRVCHAVHQHRFPGGVAAGHEAHRPFQPLQLAPVPPSGHVCYRSASRSATRRAEEFGSAEAQRRPAARVRRARIGPARPSRAA